VFVRAMERWMSGEHDADYTETWQGFQDRCVAALQRLTEQAETAESSTIVFTSGGVISVLCKHLLDLPDRKTMELNWTIANGSVTRLQHRPGRTSLSYLNNFAHLEWLGENGSVTYR
jgi:broad specificity phosphatase PhoE